MFGQRDPVLDVVLLEHAGAAEAHQVGLVRELLELLGCLLVDDEPGEHLGLVRADRLPLADRDEGQHVVAVFDLGPVVHEAHVREDRSRRDHEAVAPDDVELLGATSSFMRSIISSG